MISKVSQPWWKDATIYQVYPASFKDSNGDGWGDIPGLVSKIDYLSQLGVDVVWLSPMFESPQADMGYDISDYQKVYAAYGTVGDVDDLIEACHSRGMRLILDLVVNHTSKEHEWFRESRSSKTNPKRGWYIWKPPRYDEKGNRMPPTNWRSYFAGSTWSWDETTQEYYLHLYAPDQPDLNWESKACRQAIYDNAMRFWLDRGVDGFRVDTVNKYSKRTEFVDAVVSDPNSQWQPAPEQWCNGPRIHEFLKEMNSEVLDHYDAITVGELSNTPDPKGVLPYVSAAEKELNMVFQFDMIRLGTGDGFGSKYEFQPWKLTQLKTFVERWQKFLEGTDGWTTVFCENHDNGRAVSRFGNDSVEFWESSAKMIALWQATLTGTLFLYQGQEIGMTNMPQEWPIEEYKDIESKNFYQEAEQSRDPKRIARIMQGLQILARDHSRLPFQWDDSAIGGFTSANVKPWMRAHDNYPSINVAKQLQDPASVLSFYRRMLKLRKDHADVFIHGTFELVDAKDEKIFSYVKASLDGRKRAVVILNFTGERVALSKTVAALTMGYRLLMGTSTSNGRGHGVLDAYAGRIYVDY
ncbi:hypothetical protein LTR47_006118 [Exophiala xenobiotica]|nr:hypothetical protein LTR47_006118 [Exophiala xenobiotica]KAK5255371.1 hypothetical protein LTS06_000392 [Exophiala xenobiotica]KAK5348597.1 hypothetical protein LTR61_007624 [Exophiala xenobiotica]KAK5366839.1 hypothetical protein LTR11_008007 [Exophiala xenobiotica]KAK5368092.1 hypothetical protein LTS03_008236 [Exophiala xenobiotica]